MSYRLYLCFIVFFGVSLTAKATIPNVVVTIKPIHSLIAGVMAGVGKPTLLMKGDQSPHFQALTPKEISQVRSAQMVVWIGPSYETSIQRVIHALGKQIHVITLVDTPGMILYPSRQGGAWGNHDHCHEDEESDHERVHDHDASSTDGHLWLDPHNAKTIVTFITKELAALDPQHQADYFANSQKIIKRLDGLSQELLSVIASIRDKPYVVYHDGTQYFDRRFKTKAVGALMTDGHHGMSGGHLLQIYDVIRQERVKCLFTEPQFPLTKVQSLAEKTGVRVESLDYLGIHVPEGEDAYFLMMHHLAHALKSGLDG